MDFGRCGFVLAKMLPDGLLEVILADDRAVALALGLLLQVGAQAVQIEIAAPRLGAVLYFLPVKLLVNLQNFWTGTGSTYQTSSHLSDTLPAAGSSASLAASIWAMRSGLGTAGAERGRLYGVMKSASSALSKKVSSRPCVKTFSCGSR
jgi:hypothetical protein